MILYSASTGGFYDPSENTFVPDDALEITDERHNELLAGPAKGLRIVADDNGLPVLADPLPPSDEVLANIERSWRSDQLTATDGMVSRHRDELESEMRTTLTGAQYTELQTYRRALRDWPEAGEFPLIEHRPGPPDWLADQLP